MACKYKVEPLETTAGFVQPGELVLAKIDVTDKVTNQRFRRWSNRYYLGQNDNGTIFIEHPGTGEVSWLQLNRVVKRK